MNTLQSFIEWLLAASVRAAVLVPAVFVMRAVLQKRISAGWRHALWLPVLVVLMMPIFPESRWSVGTLMEQWTAEQTVEEPAFNTPAAFEGTVFPAEQPLEISPENISPQTPALSPIAEPPVQRFDWTLGLAGVWLGGFLALAGAGFVACRSTLRHCRKHVIPCPEALRREVDSLTDAIGLQHGPELLISSGVSSPAVTGLFKPVLLLPANFGQDLSAEQARLILKHELMHVKRGDLPLHYLSCLLLAFHWFNPLLWLAFHQARADREAACDERVLEGESTGGRHAYGSALLKMESAFFSSGLNLGFVGFFQRGAALRTRIRTIAERRRASTAMRAVTCSAMAALVFLGATRAQSPADKDVSFSIGQSAFRTGDVISIKTVERQGDLLTVSGEYELVTQEKALLMMEVTQTQKNPGSLAVDPRQRLEIQRGRGSFKLVQPNPPQGLPHVTFYGPSADSKANTRPFGAVYFGTFEEAAASNRLQLSYLLQGWVLQNFSVGQAAFRLGDSIRIKDVVRTADIITVSGEYTLASEDTAKLSLYISGDVKKPPYDAKQETVIRKGSGTFTLSHPKPYPGLPHLTFYRTGKTGESGPFGTLYFGYLEEAKESRKLDLSYLLASPAGKTARLLLQEKMDRILMPNALTVGMTLRDAVNYLEAHAQSQDTQEKDPAKRGVKIHLKSESTAQMTFLLKDLSLTEALRHITAASGTRYWLDDNGIHIADAIPQAKNPTLEKMKKLVFPQVSFNEATLQEAVEFLRVKSKALDSGEPEANKRGVNFMIKPGTGERTSLTLDLKDVPLIDLVRYVTELAGCTYRVDANAVMIEAISTPTLEAKPDPSSAEKAPTVSPAQGKAAELARNIVLPQVNFAGATVEEAVEFLRTQVRGREEAGPRAPNIIVKPSGAPQAQISLELRDVPLFTALRYIAELSNHTLSSDDVALILEAK